MRLCRAADLRSQACLSLAALALAPRAVLRVTLAQGVCFEPERGTMLVTEYMEVGLMQSTIVRRSLVE